MPKCAKTHVYGNVKINKKFRGLRPGPRLKDEGQGLEGREYRRGV
jgi:hypothetical protein